MIFWLFAKFGEAYSLSTETDVLHKFMDSIANLNSVLSNPFLSLEPFDLCVGLAGAAVIYGMVWYKRKNAKKWRKDIEYGSARWGV